eukprot:gb/GECH01015004.1/.p1 GENE.gb/GECH01015004.1/~~gb/GECH01015004.1/.p1  ORF type:complete len:134 (+),score=42.31 gb/GECH01015004.1/:1-402(+)
MSNNRIQHQFNPAHRSAIRQAQFKSTEKNVKDKLRKECFSRVKRNRKALVDSFRKNKSRNDLLENIRNTVTDVKNEAIQDGYIEGDEELEEFYQQIESEIMGDIESDIYDDMEQTENLEEEFDEYLISQGENY